MGFKMRTTSAGNDFEPCPAGTHNAVCTRLIDLGTRDGVYGPKRQLQIGFEIDEERDDGQRFMAFGYYTYSMNEKANLRKLLEGWRGKSYADDEDVDLASIVGRPAMLTIVHKTSEQTHKTRAAITAASALPKGMASIEPKGDTICLSLDPDEYDSAEYEKLTDRMREQIEETPEWAKLVNGPDKSSQPVGQAAVPDSDLDDDIPGW